MDHENTPDFELHCFCCAVAHMEAVTGVLPQSFDMTKADFCAQHERARQRGKLCLLAAVGDDGPEGMMLVSIDTWIEVAAERAKRKQLKLPTDALENLKRLMEDTGHVGIPYDQFVETVELAMQLKKPFGYKLGKRILPQQPQGFLQ